MSVSVRRLSALSHGKAEKAESGVTLTCERGHVTCNAAAPIKKKVFRSEPTFRLSLYNVFYTNVTSAINHKGFGLVRVFVEVARHLRCAVSHPQYTRSNTATRWMLCINTDDISERLQHSPRWT